MLLHPPELADPLEQLRTTLLEVNGSEHNCMTNAVASILQGKTLPVAQAVIARCRQSSAAAAATAIDTFRDECFALGMQAGSSAKAAILDAAVTTVSDFWAKSESLAAALASEAASQLPAQGCTKTTQAINNIYRDRASSINHYFEQITTQQLTI